MAEEPTVIDGEENNKSKEHESEKGQPISFFGTIITSLIISAVVCALAITYYHQNYAPQFMYFNFEKYNKDLISRLESGKLSQKDQVMEMGRLSRRIQELPPSTVIFREEVVLSDIPELK